MPYNKRFTESEIQFLKDNYTILSTEELAAALDRTERGIRGKLERLGLSLCTLDRNKPYEWTAEQLSYIAENYNSLSDAKMSKVLGVSEASVCRKRLELGLRVHKYEPYISNEYAYQYIDGVRTPLHRYVMEQHIGRPLTENERVHHLNGDKTDYRIENLYLCSGKSEHMLVHSSLEKVAFELVKSGVIKFDPVKGCYHL